MERQAHGVADGLIATLGLNIPQKTAEAWPREALGAALGTDLSAIRVHDGAEWVTRAGARALTRGHDIYFAPGQFAPREPLGLHRLVHELVHTLQQDAAPRRGGIALQLAHAPYGIAQGDWLEDLRRGAFEGIAGGLRGAQQAGLRRLNAWARRQSGSDRRIAEAVVEGVRGVSEALISLVLAVSGLVVGFGAGIIDMIRGLITLVLGVLEGLFAAIYALVDGGEALSAWGERVTTALANLPSAIAALVEAWVAEFQQASTDRQTFMIGELTGQILALIATFEFAAARAGSVPRLAAELTVPARTMAVGETLVMVPARTVVVSADVASPVAATGMVGAILMRVPTPDGSVSPSRGSYAGQNVRYGDSRGKHTRVGEHTTAELDAAARARRRPSGELGRFWDAVRDGNVSYGGQLGREAIARYGELVLAALENGVERAGKFFYEADFAIGVDISTGRVTRRFRLDGAPHGAHIIPVE